MQRKPSYRLGLKGAAEVKDHPWLKYYPWKELYDKKLDAPFIPKIGDNFDKKYCEGPDKIGDSTKGRYEKYIKEENFKTIFDNFTFFNFVLEEKNEIKDKNPKHYRSSSVPSGAFGINNQNTNNNLIKSKLKIIEKDPRATYNMADNALRNSVIGFHKNTQSYNNLYGNLIQTKNLNNKLISSEKKSSTSLLKEANSIKLPVSKLPIINNFEKLKGKKLVNSSSSNMLFKYYKQNCANSNNSAVVSFTNKIFGKKSDVNLNYKNQ